MPRRLGHIVMALLRSLDIAICAVCISALYLINLADRPTGNETISAYVGGGLLNQRGWAVWPGRVIDFLARMCGDGPDHCARAARYYRKLFV